MTGIYKIENLVNGKVYIGQARNIDRRLNNHLQELIKNIHGNQYLQNAWNKYGEENFKFEPIEECLETELDEKEIYWIDYYGGVNSENTYNLRAGGYCGGALSEVSKQKISKTLKERAYTHPAWNKGLTRETDERVTKYSMKPGEFHHTEETKQKISQLIKQKYAEGVYDNVKHTSHTLGKKYKTRIDKGTKRNSEIGKNISEGKLKANEEKRKLGLPIRNQIYPPTPMKISICEVCGKEFEQRQCHYKKTCSKECRNKAISIKQKGVKRK